MLADKFKYIIYTLLLIITISFTSMPHIVNAETIIPQTEDTEEESQTDINSSNEDSSDVEIHEMIDDNNNVNDSISDKDIHFETEGTMETESQPADNPETSTPIETPVDNIYDGWVTIDGELYYYKNEKLVVNSWVLDSDGWRYLDINGNILKKTFISDSVGLLYLGSDGYWEKSEGWRYNASVENWSYIGSNGYALKSAFTTDTVGSLYIGSDGCWEKSEGWRYNSIVKNWTYIGSNGYALTNRFATDSTGLSYLGDDGYWNSKAGWLYNKAAGKWALIGSNGYAITNAFVTDSTGLCYLGNDGYWNRAPGWRYNTAVGSWAYIGFEGYALKDSWKKDGNGWCYLTNQGYWDKKHVEGPPPSELTIMLDPGHGSNDSGAHYGGIAERELNLSVSIKVAAILESQGYNIVMTRDKKENSYSSTSSRDLYARPAKANEIGADIYVSVHHNAAGSTSASGIVTYYYGTNPNNPPLAGNAISHNDPHRINESSKLANLIHDELITATRANNRGVKRGAYVVVRETKMPAVLLELGFMSNPTELELLKNNTYQDNLASAIVRGINSYFGKN